MMPPGYDPATGEIRRSLVPLQPGHRGPAAAASQLAQLSQLRGLKNGKWFVFNEGFSKVGTTFSVSAARSVPVHLRP
jgi:hypothetical protein